MTFESETYLEQRRLRRSVMVWRVATAIAATVLVAVLIARSVGDGNAISGERVAKLYVEGVIVQDRWRDDLLNEMKDDDKVKAVMIFINSPGGTVVGGEELFLGIKGINDKKPVVAVMGSTATSAAYMAALGTRQIFAREGSVTGSIGVLMQTADITGLMEKLGIKPEIVKSGPLKAQPNPMEPFTDAAREAIRGAILDMHTMFKGMVSSRRAMDEVQVSRLADGRIFTGRQALKNGLIDAIGGELEARQWLTENHAIDADLPASIAKPDYPKADLIQRFLGLTGKVLFSERLKLDGLLSVWHPDL